MPRLALRAASRSDHFTSPEEAETIVQAWNRDEPEQAGALRVEELEIQTGTTN